MNFGKILLYIILMLISTPIVVMVVFLLVASFSERLSYGLIPTRLTLDKWSFLWGPIPWGLKREYIWPVLLNTLLYAGGSTLVRILLVTLAGYAISRISFRGRTFVLAFQMIGRVVPGAGLLVGMYFTLYYLNLLFTIPGVILIRTAMGIPMALWIMKGFFDSIPWDLEWAAMVDGCTRLQLWRKIFIPLVKPGIAAVAVFAFMEAWEDFIYVYVLLPGETKVLSVLIQRLIATEVIDYPLLAAMSLFYTIPPLLFYLITQKYLVQVTLTGGVKR